MPDVAELQKRLSDHAASRWPQIEELTVRQRAGYVYIGALLKGEIEPTKLCRLRATDDPELPLVTHIDIGVIADDACETRIRALSERAVSTLKAWRLLPSAAACSAMRSTSVDVARGVLTQALEPGQLGATAGSTR